MRAARETRPGSTGVRRFVLTSLLGAGLALTGLPGLAAAADPPASPDPSAQLAATPDPTAAPTSAPTSAPTATPAPELTATPMPEPTTTAAPEPTATPAPTPDPTVTPMPTPGPTPTPAPTPAPTAAPVAPRSMNLFIGAQFRVQDPNWRACTATSVRTMLNFIAVRRTGGAGFAWRPTILGSVRDRILGWERSHDTMIGGSGSDPHGWRNALNFYGWGPAALSPAGRVYEDVSYTSFDTAMKAAVRALVATGKTVGLLGWRGGHAQMITGYYGLVGDPFARDAAGAYTNAFSVAGFYLTDPLRASNAINHASTYFALRYTTNYRLRFQRYYETDSLLDDPYTPGYRVSKTEWYGKFVLVLPIR
jgi:hypothetical protein